MLLLFGDPKAVIHQCPWEDLAIIRVRIDFRLEE
jgi:hypothetical protein